MNLKQSPETAIPRKDLTSTVTQTGLQLICKEQKITHAKRRAGYSWQKGLDIPWLRKINVLSGNETSDQFQRKEF